MDKYSVVLEPEDESKTAGAARTCPTCGRTNLPGAGPDRNGYVWPLWYCPNCGTEPFEKKPSKG